MRKKLFPDAVEQILVAMNYARRELELDPCREWSHLEYLSSFGFVFGTLYFVVVSSAGSAAKPCLWF